MSNPPALTDREALLRNRARVHQGALFLHDLAAAEVKDRLSLVNKTFTNPALVTGNQEVWQGRFDTATVIEDCETLSLNPGAHDLVIHAMSLHWANDPVGQLIQCRRALSPDGLFLAVSLGGQTLHELRACLAQAETEICGGLSPRVAPMAELRDMGGLLQRAGFALPVADSQPINTEYRDIWHLMRDLRHMGEGNALAARQRKASSKKMFEHAAELYDSYFPGADGKVTATFDLIFLSGWAPAEDQPQPLRPGSAQHRLADALATIETPLKD